MKRITAKTFELPKKLMDDLYEASGGADRNKGFILISCNEAGQPMISMNCDSAVTEFGLQKALEKYLISIDNE